MTSSPSPFSSPPVSTASRPMTPPWQPLEDAWKALPFAEAEDLAVADALDDDATKPPSAGATQVDANERRVRFGAEMVAEFSVEGLEVATEGNALSQSFARILIAHRCIDVVSMPMDVDEPARKVDVDAQGDEAASSKFISPTSKPAKLAHPTTDSDLSKKPATEPRNPTSKPKQSTSKPKNPTSKPENPASRPKKTKTRPVSLTNPPLLPYMCRCADCAARRAEFLQTIGRRTVRWDEWPWCMVGDGYGTWYEEPRLWQLVSVIPRTRHEYVSVLAMSQSKSPLHPIHWHRPALLECQCRRLVLPGRHLLLHLIT
ncbi:hypothetical protein EV714DRAFT_217299 [Schizophyllum commune]